MHKLRIAVAIVRSHTYNKFLLLRYKDTEDTSFWYFPNNLIFMNQNAADAAMKLVLEQTDIRCRIQEEICYVLDDQGHEWHFVAAEQIFGPGTPKTPDVIEVNWYTAAEIRKRLPPMPVSLPAEVEAFLERQ